MSLDPRDVRDVFARDPEARKPALSIVDPRPAPGSPGGTFAIDTEATYFIEHADGTTTWHIVLNYSPPTDAHDR